MVLDWDVESSRFRVDACGVRWGFCVVMPFGEYEGGVLVFPGLYLNPGYIMVFPSQYVYFGYSPVTSGKLHSLMLSCCANNF
jgi:uncharacterized protein (DUF3820 family)